MLKIIQHSEIKQSILFERLFSYDQSKFTFGFSFQCDESGHVDTSRVSNDSLNKCLSGFVDGTPIYDLGIYKISNTYRQPAIGECSCGQEVCLGGFTNSCDCGRDYNSVGQELAPREFWGEETGESVGEILQIQ